MQIDLRRDLGEEVNVNEEESEALIDKAWRQIFDKKRTANLMKKKMPQIYKWVLNIKTLSEAPHYEVIRSILDQYEMNGKITNNQKRVLCRQILIDRERRQRTRGHGGRKKKGAVE